MNTQSLQQKRHRAKRAKLSAAPAGADAGWLAYWESWQPYIQAQYQPRTTTTDTPSTTATETHIATAHNASPDKAAMNDDSAAEHPSSEPIDDVSAAARQHWEEYCAMQYAAFWDAYCQQSGALKEEPLSAVPELNTAAEAFRAVGLRSGPTMDRRDPML